MARRESQGLQIALILFVMITVVLAITTFLYWRKAEEVTLKRKTTEEKYQTIQTSIRDVHIPQGERLREMMGYQIDDTMEVIEAGYSQDSRYWANEDAGKQNYRGLPDIFLVSIVDSHKQYASSRVRETQLEADKGTIREAEQAVTAAAQADAETASTDLVGERGKFDADRAEFVQDGQVVSQRLEDIQRQSTEQIATLQREIQSLGTRLSRAEQLSEALKEELKNSNPSTIENFDGEVTWVNQGSGIVWINLGSADGLRRQVSFTVYELDENNLATAEPKGTIEVLRIMDQHLAEARITQDSIADPILPRDLIYSSVWHPGQKLRFALAGFMDIDNDGDSDREQVRHIITMNGGIIDAEVKDDGTREGALSIHTRFLIIGERPTDQTDAEAIRGYTNILGEAHRLGVEQMSIEKLLSYVGFRGEDHSVRLDRGASAEDFRARPEGGVPSRSTGDTFRQRRPPTRGEAGAY